MVGTTPVGAFAKTASTGGGAMTPTTWFSQSDANSAVAMRSVDLFAPRPASTPAMSVVLDAGFVVATTPGGQQTVTEMTAQTVTIGTAPGSPNNRVDLIVVDAATGSASVVAGTPATTAVAPAAPAGKLVVARIYVPNGTTSIVNANIWDLRAVWASGVPGLPWAVGGGTGDAITATYTPANISLVDGLLLAVRAPAANTSSAPTFSPDGLTAHAITRWGGHTLRPGEIPGSLAEVILRFNAAYSRWELETPAVAVPAWAVCGGSSDALTAAPALAIPALYDGLLITGRAAYANATTTPTLAVSGLTATVITKRGGAPLAVGDIPGAGAECLWRYNASTPCWELLNAPASTAPTWSQVISALGYTPADATAIGNLKGVFSTATNMSISTGQTGELINITGTSALTITFPDPASCAGAIVRLINTAADVAVYFATAGSGAVLFFTNSVWSTDIPPGVWGRAMFESNGANWYGSLLFSQFTTGDTGGSGGGDGGA